MKLYWLRHGIAADREEWSGDDADRPLTSDGRKIIEREAKGMAALEIRPDLILTSPLKRAKETAAIVADRLACASPLTDERVAGIDRETVMTLLRDHHNCDSLLLVGHEPDFSATIGDITGGSRIVLKKGGLARVDVDDTSSTQARLVWLLPPKALIH